MESNAAFLREMALIRQRFFDEIAGLPEGQYPFPTTWETLPNENRKVKHIACVKNLADAKYLANLVQSIVDRTNVALRRCAEQNTFIVHPVKMDIKTIHVSDSISLTKSLAEKRLQRNGQNILEEAEQHWEQLGRTEYATNELDEIKYFIRSDAVYLCGRSTGSSYRITYFDPYEERRMQISVGDMVIAIGADGVVQSGSRKTRSDKLSPVVVVPPWAVYYEVKSKDMKDVPLPGQISCFD